MHTILNWLGQFEWTKAGGAHFVEFATGVNIAMAHGTSASPDIGLIGYIIPLKRSPNARDSR